MSSLIVERALPGDLSRVLALMKELAEFEGYLDEFCVTEASLKSALFKNQSCEIIVARGPQQIEGLAVFYSLPFTYDLKPWLFLKELIVESGSRGNGVGKALMHALIDIARKRGAGRLKWDVLKSNAAARDFYLALGAEEDVSWTPYCLRL